jgi:hypothetical protein
MSVIIKEFGVIENPTAEAIEARLIELKQLFDENPHLVVDFAKVNGEIRTMPSTLNESLIPKKTVPEGAPSKSENKRLRAMDVMAVFATDIQEWRSFKVANVLRVQIRD